MLTREAILSSNDLPTEPVEVPEWGGTIHVRAMSGTDRDAFEASMIDGRKGGSDTAHLRNIRARLMVLTACDGKGERLFTDEDAIVLGRKSSKALDRVFAVAQRLNGLSADDVKALEGN